MNPLGIALAFVLFWCAIGLGLFITFSAFLGLGRTVRAPIVVSTRNARALAAPLMHVGLIALGIALVAVGAYANYIVIYQH